jgi:transaldolase
MQIFLDTASVEEIKQAAKLGIISGVTTNPSLMAKEKGADYKTTVQEICSILGSCISAEVLSLKAEEMVEEAKRIATWSPHVVVKVPMTPEGIAAISVLSTPGSHPGVVCDGCQWKEGCEEADLTESEDLDIIQTNCTLVFSPNQALFAALAGATYVSPFVGRLDDVGEDGMAMVADTVDIFDTYGLETQIIAASIRHPLHITAAAKAGAHIATVPYKVLMQSMKHPLTDIGIERFLSDWKKSQENK